ncbi:uncharacterized protein ACNS7B_009351 [Menidia menidia]
MNGAVYISFFQGQLESVLEQVVQLAVQQISSSVGSSLNALLLETAAKEQENRRLRLQLQASAEDHKNKAGEERGAGGGRKPEPPPGPREPGQRPPGPREPGPRPPGPGARVPPDTRRLEQRGRVVDQLKCVMEQVLDFALRELTKIVEASFDDLLLEITKMDREQALLQDRLGRGGGGRGGGGGSGGASPGPGGAGPGPGAPPPPAGGGAPRTTRCRPADPTRPERSRPRGSGGQRPPVTLPGPPSSPWPRTGFPSWTRSSGRSGAARRGRLKIGGGAQRGRSLGGSPPPPAPSSCSPPPPPPSRTPAGPRWRTWRCSPPMRRRPPRARGAPEPPRDPREGTDPLGADMLVLCPLGAAMLVLCPLGAAMLVYCPLGGGHGRSPPASMLHRLLTLPSQMLEDDADEEAAARETLVALATNGGEERDGGELPEGPSREEEEEEEEDGEEEEDKGRKKKRRRVWSECEDCGRRFSRASLLKTHRQTHLRDLDSAPLSGDSAPLSGDSAPLSGDSAPPLCCPHCGRRFSSSARLHSHVRTQHPEGRS